jgi:hypothetical protein
MLVVVSTNAASDRAAAVLNEVELFKGRQTMKYCKIEMNEKRAMKSKNVVRSRALI